MLRAYEDSVLKGGEGEKCEIVVQVRQKVKAVSVNSPLCRKKSALTAESAVFFDFETEYQTTTGNPVLHVRSLRRCGRSYDWMAPLPRLTEQARQIARTRETGSFFRQFS